MKFQIIKTIVCLAFVGLGYIFIRFGDKQFGQYGFVGRFIFDDRSGIPEKIRKFNRIAWKWIWGLFFILIGVIGFVYVQPAN